MRQVRLISGYIYIYILRNSLKVCLTPITEKIEYGCFKRFGHMREWLMYQWEVMSWFKLKKRKMIDDNLK